MKTSTVIVARVSDTVGYAGGRNEHRPRIHLDLSAFQQEEAASLEDVVDLVLIRVPVKRVLLAWLERVQPDEHPIGHENRRLSHLLRVELCKRLGTNEFGMIHARISVEVSGHTNVAATPRRSSMGWNDIPRGAG